MPAIRQYYEDAPATILIPEPMRHKRLVVILQIQDDETAVPTSQNLKSLLSAMPDVGTDADFARPLDYGRDGVQWDS